MRSSGLILFNKLQNVYNKSVYILNNVINVCDDLNNFLFHPLNIVNICIINLVGIFCSYHCCLLRVGVMFRACFLRNSKQNKIEHFKNVFIQSF